MIGDILISIGGGMIGCVIARIIFHALTKSVSWDE